MAELRIRLLGGLDVEGIALRDLGSRKSRTLIKVLALGRGAAVSTDRIVDALWAEGNDLPERPVDQVGVLVSRLRRVLGSDRFTRTDAGWALHVDWLDLDELADQVGQATAFLRAGRTDEARAAAGAALALGRGELLAEGPDAPWAVAERTAAARLAHQARSVRAEAAMLSGDFAEAVGLAETLMGDDPYDEGALRLIMRAHAATGSPAAALAAYAKVRAVLGDELGVSPSPETEALHEAILLADPTGAAVSIGDNPGAESAPPVSAGGGGAARTLQAAAVLGMGRDEMGRDDMDLDLALIAGVLGIQLVDLLGHVDAAVHRGVLVERDGTVGFRDASVRDAIAASTLLTQQALLHRQAATILAAQPNADDLAVAFHARMGGDPFGASSALVRAAKAAAAGSDLGEASRLLDEAVLLDGSHLTHVARARVRLASHDTDGAASDISLALARGGDVEALELAGWIAYYRRDHAGALRYADEGAARATDEKLRASCLVLAGRVRHSRGEFPPAEAHLTEALAAAAPEIRGLAQVWLGALRNHQGRPHEAEELELRATLQPERLHHPFALFHGLFARAVAVGMQGRIAEALTVIESTLALADREGAQGLRFRPMLLNTRSWLLRNVGLLGAAREANEEALASEGIGLLTGEPWYVAHLDLADGALAAGDPDTAASLLGRIDDLDSWNGVMGWHQRQRLGLLRARMLLASCDASCDVTSDATGEAAALARQVAEDAAARGTLRYQLLAEIVEVEALALGGAVVDHARVDAILGELDTLAVPEAWWLTAHVAAATGTDRWWDAAERRAARIVVAGSHAGIEGGDAVAARLAALRLTQRKR